MTIEQRRSNAPDKAVTAAVSCRGLTRRYADGLLALDRLDLEVAAGEIVAVVGPSGAGKSTLLELICRLQRPDEGTIAAEPAALMPQRDALLPWLDATGNAAIGLRVSGSRRRAATVAAARLLDEIGLREFRRAKVWQLSSGMRQRVAVARTLLSGAAVLCLDEPFGALDAITRDETQRWLISVLSARPRTVLLVTHDVEEAALLGDRVLVLSPRPGRIVAELKVDLPRGESGRDRSDPIVRSVCADALTALKHARTAT